MYIKTLTCNHFRNLANTTLTFHPQGNWIYGLNGSGKTAFIEMLYLLGRGKSFRTNQTKTLITHTQPYLRLIAQIHKNQQPHLLGIEKTPQQHTQRLNGEPFHGLSKLAQLTPICLLNNTNFALLDQGPEQRRKFIDFGVFYADPQFFPQWQRYQYALKNRNAALKQQWADNLILPWQQLLSDSAKHIDTMRQHYLARLENALNHYHAQLGGLEPIRLVYHRGWQAHTSLANVLQHHLERDKLLKHTRDGIHRAELRFYANEQDITQYFSRGQQKTLLSALILAQASLIAQDSGTHPIMLIDDLSAELDFKRQKLLLSFIIQSATQWFITSINAPSEDLIPSNSQIFYLENGHFNRKD
ncbi:DNA replication/repair protein RecF [Rappaport israeli]|uniref:DNA replication/repair protein RecF n=1 Tax=Rappaport israeli TaxID=1839807 RepID=UPI000930FE81|nr:DNA replication/repair protein RecF [Rappaport israeli]